MAYIVRDEDTSMLNGGGASFKSFLTSNEDPTLLLMAPPPNSFSFVKRNLASEMHRITREEDSLFLPPPSPRETVSVYLRVKPKTPEESEYYSCRDESDLASIEDDSFEVVTIESDFQVALHAPKDSNTYKNSINGAGSLCHRFTFSKIFQPATEQEQVFREMVQPKLKEFLEGRNQLLFTYGATSSGKTFTIQGDSFRPGILPRALDAVFNSIGHRLMVESAFKPLGFKGVKKIEDDEVRKVKEEKMSVFKLGKELTTAIHFDQMSSKDSSKMSVASNGGGEETQNCSQASQQSLATMFPQFSNRVRESLSVQIPASDKLQYSIWVSFCEIYNENIYDLLEKMPEVKRKGDKPRRMPLKLAEDREGCVFIKGLKEISVVSADEAYQLMMIGRENLQFAATRLNHNSSRSHCIFTVKVIRVVDREKPHLARMSMLSFCDLAGSERIKKTLNTGDRQKEAGNINTSLLVLGRCIKAIRHNQMIKDHKKHQMVPFRESKLTRLFQSFFTGLGKASMIVNVSQSPYLFDESCQVLKFAAIACKVNIAVQKDPVEPEAEAVAKNDSRKRRQSQFAILVKDKKAKESLLNGRGSITWDNPPLRSTMCPLPNTSSATIAEEDENEMSTYEIGTANGADETAVDTKYDGMLQVIEDLKNQLIEEKQKNIKLEVEVRKELCEEFDKMIVEIETNWETRLQEERDRNQEYSEWRINKVQDTYRERNQQRKRQRIEDSQEEGENFREKIEELETKVNDKQAEVDQLEKQVTAMKTVHSSMMAEQNKQQEEISKQSFELSNAKNKISEMQMKLAATEDKLKATNQALEEQSADPKIKDLTREVNELTAQLMKSKDNINYLQELVKDAVQDHETKSSEITNLEEANQKLKAVEAEKNLQLEDLETQLEEYRQLYSNANEMIEEKDSVITKYEEQIEKLKIKLEKEDQDSSQKWLDHKAMAQQLSNLNDEIENIKKEKKKLKSLVDAKESDLVVKDKEIKDLEREVKSLIQAEKQQRDAKVEIQSEVTMLRKQQKDLNLKVSEVETLSRSLKDKQSTIEQLQMVIDANKKEGNAIEVLRHELNRKNEQKAEMEQKIEILNSNVSSLKYDLDRTKIEKEELMNHYKQLLTKTTEELAMEKRESSALREHMSRTTPLKSSEAQISKLKEDVQKLRDELNEKSELIKTLSRNIAPTPNREDEDLREDNRRLQKELEDFRISHSQEMATVRKAYEKIITEYKDTNLLLQGGQDVKSFDLSLMTHTEEENIFDDSLVGAAAADASRKSNVPKRKTSATTQVSFEDSTTENEHPDELRGSRTSPPRKVPRRGTRVSGTRPARGGARPRATVSFAEGDEDNYNRTDESYNQQSESRRTRKGSTSSLPPCIGGSISSKPLQELQLSPLDECQDGSSPVLKSSITGGKKKLFSHSRGVEVFTPPDVSMESQSPHSIVQRQLRTRKSRKM